MKQRDTVRDALALREIQAALKASRQSQAEELAGRAIADGVVDPLPYYVRAQGWMRRGKSAEAVRDLHEAIALAPRNVALRNTVATLLVTWQHPREAAAILEEAVRLDSRLVATRFNLGWAYERSGELALCRSAYAKALELDPRHADTLARLAGVAFRQGELEDARDYAERALAIMPTSYNALATRASVALRQRDFDKAEVSVQKLVALEKIPPTDHADALGLLGDVRDGQGRYREAFQAYASANREKIRVYAPQLNRANTKSFGDFAATLADYFEKARPEDWSTAGAREESPSPHDDSPAGHAFLVGFARSGTTLLENVLATHPGVATLAEEATLNETMVKFFSDESGLERLKLLPQDEADAARQSYWTRVRERRADIAGKVVVDDNPFYSLSLSVIARLFPRAKIIFALRDPRDVVLSCFRRRIGINLAIFELLTLERAARFYDSTMRLRTVYRETLGLDWLDLRHESLVEDFDGEAAKLSDFLGLNFVTGMRDFATNARSRAIRTTSAAQISRGLNAEGVGHWRHYAEELAPILPILEPWVERFGYEAR